MLFSRSRILTLIFLSIIIFSYATYSSIQKLPKSLNYLSGLSKKPQILDRSGKPLSITFENSLNINDQKNITEIPDILKKAFIFSEDKRFYSHNGVDWLARLNALTQKGHRGASTITEQVVRMIHPRPRNIWSRWIEGFEAMQLEKISTKDEIFGFYLNQVPYAARRRGVALASNYYFNRSLNTLSIKEMLALVIFVRAPNLVKIESKYFNNSLILLADKLISEKVITLDDKNLIINDKLKIEHGSLDIDASHFVRYVLNNSKQLDTIHTSLDTELQIRFQDLIEERLKFLKNKNVNNAALLAIDNSNSSIVAWVNAKNNGFHDAVRIKRQAGSTLKPFLYSLAIQKGWTAATIINDAPIDRAVGVGLHAFQNYSRTFYGPIRLRMALGNSLNSTAIRTITFVGSENFLNLLRNLEFKSLNKSSEFYGDGLALGNAEVSLFELVQAYHVLANKGEFNHLNFNFEQGNYKKILNSKITSLIANILSDKQARALEFGSLFNFPVQTAIKTGTSNDFKDAWAIGFTNTHTIGIWMGNLNRESMKEVSGAIGPAYLLRSSFAEINRKANQESLFLSPDLIQKDICPITGKLAVHGCNAVTEWFDISPTEKCEGHKAKEELETKSYIKYPTPGLNMAMDPRIPDQDEVFEFKVGALGNLKQVEWYLDGKIIARTQDTTYRWNLVKGKHRLYAIIYYNDDNINKTGQVKFVVK